jgi:adenylate kinase family enzyme
MYNRDNYLKNKREISEKSRKWYDKNKEQVVERVKEYNQKIKKKSEYFKKYYQTNKNIFCKI